MGDAIQSVVVPTLDQSLVTATAVPVATESMNLEAILNAQYEAEVAYHQALWEQAQAQMAAAAAAQAAAIQSLAAQSMDINTLVDQTMAGLPLENMGVTQDLTNINQLMPQNNNLVGNAFGEGMMTAGGFIMPTAAEKETLYKIVAAEGGNIAPQEATNILSTMLNRAKTGNWGGQNLLTIATRPNQYVVYQSGAYLNAALTPESRAACDSLIASVAAGGPTSHIYQSFRSSGSTSYSNNQFVPGGNRYGVPMV